MSSSHNFFLLITFFGVIRALSELERVPSTCSRPGSRATCDFSTSTKEVTVCGVYKEEECVLFCRYLASQLNSTKPPCSYSVMTSQIMKNLLATCHSSCNSASKQILSEENRSKKFNARALIYLTVKPHGVVESKFKIFKKQGRSSVTRSSSNPQTNTCECSGCLKRGAHCPRCCHDDHWYYWMSKCSCGNCKKYGAYCPTCCEYAENSFV